MTMNKDLEQLTQKLTKCFGGDLVSVVLYGSAAGEDFHTKFSDFNVLCVVRAVTPGLLEDAEPVMRWWREKGNPAPLLLSEEEVRTSTDCFPIEFHDMLERRRILLGADVIEGLEVDDSFYRAQVEHELRAKMLRLRTKAAGALFDSSLLLKLMADSVTTFLVLARHALKLGGLPAPIAKREITAALRASITLDTAPLETLLDVREDKTSISLDARAVFASYLSTITHLVDFVDGLRK
jgi:predicted nucleotidyltransferase